MKTWNVLAGVVTLVQAQTREEAIAVFEEALRSAGFDVYSGQETDAFESES
jgi:hypothetical protein